VSFLSLARLEKAEPNSGMVYLLSLKVFNEYEKF
jgi:hypothetical protein